jgi:RNA polymerase sigma-70 factor, ECF subfamily
VNGKANVEPVPGKGEESLNIALLKRGDTVVFAQFVRQFQDMVFACGRTVGLRDDELEDAASETFLAAYRYIGSYSGKGKLSSWLWKIAWHKAVDYRRMRSPAGPLSENDDADAATDEPGPEAVLEAQERGRLLWQAVRKLPEGQAAAIVLFYREGMSTRAIAEALDSPENTVRIWLHRGRGQLYERLKSLQETNHAGR